MRQTLSSDAQPPMDLYNGLVDSHSGSITGRLRYMAPEVAQDWLHLDTLLRHLDSTVQSWVHLDSTPAKSELEVRTELGSRTEPLREPCPRPSLGGASSGQLTPRLGKTDPSLLAHGASMARPVPLR